jgi:hypothetical protein
MPRIATAFLSLLVLLAATAGVASATPESRFNALIGKSAADDGDIGVTRFVPKAACVCQDGTSLNNWPGVLVRTGDTGAVLFCKLVTFGPEGQVAGWGYCSNFTILK